MPLRLHLLAAVLLVLGCLPAQAQGLVGGTLRGSDNSLPAASAITIRVRVVENLANEVSFPGVVSYSNGVYSVDFDRFPQPLAEGQTLRIQVRDGASSSGATLEVPIVSLDAAHVGNIRLSPLFPAVVRVLRVLAPSQVSRGQRAIPVRAEISNTGGEPGGLAGLTLLLAGSESAPGYSIATPAGAPVEIAAGASVTVTFLVDVLSAAPLGPTTLDVRLDADADGADAPGAWRVEISATVRILSVLAPASVSQGQRRVPIDVTVRNDGTLEGSLENPEFRFTAAAGDRSADYDVTLPVSNPTSLPGGEATTLVFLVAVRTTAQTGPVTVDFAVDGDRDGAEQPAVWNAISAAIVRVVSVTAPPALAQGQTGVPIVVSVENSGSLSSPLSGLSLRLTRGDEPAGADYTVTLTGPLPSTIGPGGTAMAVFRADLSPLAATGPVRARATVDQDAEGAAATWTVSARNLCPAAVAGTGRLIVVTTPDVDITVTLIGHDSVDPDGPATGALEYSWRLAHAVSEGGQLLETAPAFLAGEADPAVRLRAAGDYRFGLTVRETGGERCVSPESFVTVAVRSTANTPPAARASIVDPVSGSHVASAALTSSSFPVTLRLVAEPARAGSFDAETPEEAIRFAWSRRDEGALAPGPAALITNATSREATVTLTAPGAYGFTVVATDDGRPAASSPPDPSRRRRGLPSPAASVTARPPGNTFPAILALVASAPGRPQVGFSDPVLIPATASAASGGYPAVDLSAQARDAESAVVAIVWRQVPGRDFGPAVRLDALPGGRARFWATASGLYRFEATASDGVLGARAELIVPVDDLRPGGRAGVTPVVGGVPGSAGALGFTTSAAELELDASGSVDRNALYGRAGPGLRFTWTQLGGTEDLLFDASGSRIVLRPAAAGTYTLALVADNGQDAVRQELTVSTGGAAPAQLAAPLAAGGSGGCRMTAGAASYLPDALTLLAPLALLRRRRPIRSRAASRRSPRGSRAGTRGPP